MTANYDNGMTAVALRDALLHDRPTLSFQAFKDMIIANAIVY
ncbi:hypothetical protein AVDCRST_MAG94-4080 [uncultured Leptolyngbya sp.]|uniref:Uncharacterized protein n=1 Tax=uncultured Leptolyngbya sp. TaxID=332963 RepID=A0A6J4MYB8_9CYAN|nr:hypothetical protein AVDCRST_MAG94-4080 [uncultured Leptolyngbya sp.]